MASGSTEEGLIAFKKKIFINENKPSLGYKYVGLYFADSRDAVISSYALDDVTSVTHNAVIYSPYEGGFVSENTMKNSTSGNKLKQFNEGMITLKDGTTHKGQISLVNQASANFKSRDGIFSLYPSEEIERFDVTVGIEKKAVINIEDKLTEEYYRGTTFLAYDNPTPTTVNKNATSLARNAVSLSTSVTSSLIISKVDKKNGYKSNLDSLVMHSSVEELKVYRDGLLAVQGYKSSADLQARCNNESIKAYDLALDLAISGKEMREKIIIYYDEKVIKNLTTNETTILYQNKKYLKEKLEGLLMGCYTFLSLDKKAQKEYYDLDIIGETVKMLDECY